jgi:hypothetical protein
MESFVFDAGLENKPSNKDVAVTEDGPAAA